MIQGLTNKKMRRGCHLWSIFKSLDSGQCSEQKSQPKHEPNVRFTVIIAVVKCCSSRLTITLQSCVISPPVSVLGIAWIILLKDLVACKYISFSLCFASYHTDCTSLTKFEGFVLCVFWHASHLYFICMSQQYSGVTKCSAVQFSGVTKYKSADPAAVCL